jgi:hypothetical protein
VCGIVGPRAYPGGAQVAPLDALASDLGSTGAFLFHAGRETCSLGGGVRALPLARVLRRPALAPSLAFGGGAPAL